MATLWASPVQCGQAMPMPFISAIVCTHNRADYVGAAIDSLLQQTYPSFEVIVVDNASVDSTRAIVATRCSDPRLQYIYEETLGLSVARNRGGWAAAGEILAYLDDDAEASPDWLAALAEGFQDHPQVMIAGGRVTLIWPPHRQVPGWLSPTLSASLGAYDLGSMPQTIHQAGQTPRGLNYAIKKTFFEAMGGFDTQLGRVGTNLLSNEELHMTQRALDAGVKVLYLPQALVAHHVAPERLTPAWFLGRSWWQGISECHREQVTECLTRQRLQARLRCCARGAIQALWSWPDPAQRFENLVYAYGQLGYLWSGVKALSGKI
jgi:glycosyltransferase involved in cell wall biosynthesis